MALTKAQELTVDILKMRGFSPEEIFTVLATMKDYKELNAMMRYFAKYEGITIT